MTFDVGLIGDTGYTSSQLAAFVKERDEKLNPAGLAFVTHDGDIKSGDSPCGDSVYLNVRDIFNGFTAPLIYTPGDNEWSDCSDQLDRLDFIRQTFFSNNQTLGQHRFTVTRQAGYPENARWTYGNVVFATLNTPGGSNNVSHPDEWGPRNVANLAWMRAAFDAGASARGVVVVTQANWGDPYNDTSRRGFDDLKQLLEDETVAYGKPVVLVHGDTHTFRIEHPMAHDGHVVSNFTRVETYAPSSTHWVKLSIVADSRSSSPPASSPRIKGTGGTSSPDRVRIEPGTAWAGRSPSRVRGVGPWYVVADSGHPSSVDGGSRRAGWRLSSGRARHCSDHFSDNVRNRDLDQRHAAGHDARPRR